MEKCTNFTGTKQWAACYTAVRFPPRRVEVEVSPSSPVVGSRASLRCWTDPSSPGTKLVTQHIVVLWLYCVHHYSVAQVWYHNGRPVAATKSESRTEKLGGTISSTLLEVDVTEDHIDSVYKCEASHPAATSKRISNTTKIAVQCE